MVARASVVVSATTDPWTVQNSLKSKTAQSSKLTFTARPERSRLLQPPLLPATNDKFKAPDKVPSSSDRCSHGRS